MSIDEEPPGLILVVIAGIGAILLWLGAELAALLASGSTITAPAAVVLRSVFVALAHPGSPAQAWPARVAAQLPGPVGYWSCTAVVCGVGGTAAVLGARVVQRFSGETRTRFGVEASARLARPSELRPLIIKRPTPGRFELGRVGRHRIATEDVDASTTRRSQRGLPPAGTRPSDERRDDRPHTVRQDRGSDHRHPELERTGHPELRQVRPHGRHNPSGDAPSARSGSSTRPP